MCYNIEYVPYINALLGCPAAVCAYPLSAQTMAIPMILFSSVIRRIEFGCELSTYVCTYVLERIIHMLRAAGKLGTHPIRFDSNAFQ